MKVNRIQFQAVLSMPIFFKDHEIEGQCEQAPRTFRKVSQCPLLRATLYIPGARFGSVAFITIEGA